MDKGGAKPVCAQEALDLLNCVAESPSYDQDKCLALLNSLRECVLAKLAGINSNRILFENRAGMYGIMWVTFDLKVKKFSLAGQEQQETNPSNKKA
ncbi:hypothetical protein KIW84_070757 [Lathyrus oleraceus]|uniref:Uncharacterized protein n=1 Tax=Pisum sativum TaxID=3888 RepID=A0A9D4ZV13_PEA|nr:hypothetical protein KIW84_070757 [Pisum sativum]